MNHIVFHKINSRFGSDWFNGGPDSVKLSDYEKVAFVLADDLDEVFHDTNHIDCEWWENLSVTLVKESRSTSVEDLVITSDGKAFLCMPAGWKEVSIEDAAKQWAGLWGPNVVSNPMEQIALTRFFLKEPPKDGE